jgi:hypothetical protein
MARNVHREDRFNEQLRKIESDHHKAEALVEGPIWVLSREPSCGSNIRESSVWYILSNDVPNDRTLIIWYTFNPEVVILLSVTVASDDDDLP